MADAIVANHYTINDLGDQILAGLKASGADLEALTLDDLAPVDAFHIRGRVATAELASKADIKPQHRLLDVGCGLGGTSRFLAATKGCHVVGIDLTAAYCQVAEMLSARVGLKKQTEFQIGDALALPFDEAAFDAVWTEHAQMNIKDKSGFYREIARVCKQGGQFAFHDILAGNVTDLHFPVPWASDASISHLIRADVLKSLLSDLGFKACSWEDKTKDAIDFFRLVVDRFKAGERPHLGLHILMGQSAHTKFQNVLRNLEQNRIQVIQAVMTLGRA